MGPIILFDKSLLQALSVDESVWFDHFFLTNICPIFFAETLADLEKPPRPGRTSQGEVRLLATRTPELSSYPNVFHVTMCLAELYGRSIPMDGRIVLSGGKAVRTSKRTGVVFEVSPEAEALARWSQGQFWEVERLFARSWRTAIRFMNLDRADEVLEEIGVRRRRYRSLEEARKVAEAAVNDVDHRVDKLRLVIQRVVLDEGSETQILAKWGDAGHAPLAELLPYTAYVLTVDVFFYLSVAARLLPVEKVTNRIDLAYLYYLPFCMVFTSCDKVHRRCAPLFLRRDQQFVWGGELKQALERVDFHYSTLSDKEQEKGLFAIAPRPPLECETIISQLWDRFCPGWRERKELRRTTDEATSSITVEEVKHFMEAEPLAPAAVDFDPSKPEMMGIKRRVRKRKGRWWQLPKDLKNDS